MNRNLWLLALCQGLFLTNNVGSPTRKTLAFTDAPTLTGVPLAPTAAAGTNTSQIAGSSVQIGHAIHEKQVMEAAVIAQQHHFAKAMPAQAAGGGLEQGLESGGVDAQRTGKAHVRGRRLDRRGAPGRRP